MKLFLFLFFPLIGLGQNPLTGFIVDKITGDKIPYATVGLTMENKGITANDQGAFSIHSSYSQRDSLRISCVGYETLVIPVSGWVNGTVVTLQQKAALLKDLVISTNRHKQVHILNPFRRCSWNSFVVGLDAVYQVAQRFDAPEPGMFLQELQLCKDPSESIFRIRIYDVDSITGGPLRELADTMIEVRSTATHVRLNLEEYGIVIPGKSFFVAVEWLFIPFNETIEKEKRDGRKTSSTNYKPAIRFVFEQNAKQGKVWILGFNGKWSEMIFPDKDFNFQFTVKLK